MMMNISLPVELWAQIFRKLTKPEWHALCATCRLLSTIARPHLYECIDIWNQIPPDLNQRALLLARSFAERPELSGLVHTLTLFSTGVTLEPSKLTPWIVHPILAHLSSFNRLEALTIAGLRIDFDFCNKVHSLRRLQAISLVACSIDPKVREVPLRSIPGSNVSELFIIHPRSLKGWSAIASLGLRSLSISESNLTPLPGSNILMFETAILWQLTLEGIYHSLTKLEWSQPIIPVELIRLLELAPQVRFLSFRHPHQMHSRHVKYLSPGAIPMLQQFSGPARYAETFVRERPVRDVTLGLGFNTQVDVLDVLRFSTTPVTRLSLYTYHEDGYPASRVAVDSIMKHAPPTLLYLYWGRDIKKGEFGFRWRSAFSRLTALRVFDTSGWGEYRDKSLRKEIMQAASETCLSLREVIFRGNARFVWRNDGTWEEYIL